MHQTKGGTVMPRVRHVFRIVFLMSFLIAGYLPISIADCGEVIPDWECVITDIQGVKHQSDKCGFYISKEPGGMSIVYRDWVMQKIGALEKTIHFVQMDEFTIKRKGNDYDIEFRLRGDKTLQHGFFSPRIREDEFNPDYVHQISVGSRGRISLSDIKWPITIRLKPRN
jgi:hypothetical protein